MSILKSHRCRTTTVVLSVAAATALFASALPNPAYGASGRPIAVARNSASPDNARTSPSFDVPANVSL